MTLESTTLQQFTGSEHWYRHPLFRHYLYTDGVQYVAEQGGAFWLIDKIFANQLLPALQDEGFQFWTLNVHDDRSAILTCTDGDDRTLHREIIAYTDFPLRENELYFTNRGLLLPSVG